MPFTDIGDFSPGDVLTAADLDLIRANLLFFYSPPACRVRNSATISVATSGAVQVLTFDTEDFDTDTMHSTVSLTGRITFTTAGVYVVTGCIEYASNATGYRAASIRRNGGNEVGSTVLPAVNGNVTRCIATTISKFTAGQFVELLALQTSGAALNATVTGENGPAFSATWVGNGT